MSLFSVRVFLNCEITVSNQDFAHAEVYLQKVNNLTRSCWVFFDTIKLLDLRLRHGNCINFIVTELGPTLCNEQYNQLLETEDRPCH